MTPRNRILLYMAGILIIMISSSFIFPRYGTSHKAKNTVENSDQEIVSEERLSTITEEIVQENQNAYTIYLQRPAVVNLADSVKEEAVNTFIQNSFDSLINDFKKSLPVEYDKNDQSSLEGEYEVIYFSESLFSIRINYSQYLAGATDMSIDSMVLNYDLNNSTELTLDNVFNQESDYLSFLSTTTYQELSKAYSSNEKETIDWIKNVTSEKKENFSKFIFNKKEMIIQFPTEEIGAIISGADEVKILAANLLNYMSDSSLKTFWEEI